MCSGQHFGPIPLIPFCSHFERQIASLMLAALMFCSGCRWLSMHQLRADRRCQELVEQSVQAENEGDVDAAREYLLQAKMTDRQNAETHWRLAELAVRDDDYQKAYTHLQDYLKRRPDDTRGHLRYAQIAYIVGDLESAEQTAQTAFTLSPQNIDVLLMQARIAVRQENYTRAIELYHQLLKTYPQHTGARLELADVYLNSERSDQAIVALRSLHDSIWITPKEQVAVLEKMGVTYGLMNRWDDAYTVLAEHATSLDKLTENQQYRLAYAATRSGEYEVSQQLLEKLIAQNPDYQPAYQLARQVVSYQQQGVEQTALIRLTSAEGNQLQLLDSARSSVVPPEWR